MADLSKVLARYPGAHWKKIPEPVTNPHVVPDGVTYSDPVAGIDISTREGSEKVSGVGFFDPKQRALAEKNNETREVEYCIGTACSKIRVPVNTLPISATEE